MNAVEAEARVRAIVAALWPEHAIDTKEHEGEAIVRVTVTVPALRVMPIVTEMRRTSLGRAWRALLPLFEHRAQAEAERMLRHAADLEARAAHERAKAERVRAIVVGNASTEGT